MHGLVQLCEAAYAHRPPMYALVRVIVWLSAIRVWCNCIEARWFMYDESQNLVRTATKPQSSSAFHRQLFRGKYLQSRVQSAFCGRACVRRLRRELYKDYSVSNASTTKQIFELGCKLDWIICVSFYSTDGEYINR